MEEGKFVIGLGIKNQLKGYQFWDKVMGIRDKRTRGRDKG